MKKIIKLPTLPFETKKKCWSSRINGVLLVVIICSCWVSLLASAMRAARVSKLL